MWKWIAAALGMVAALCAGIGLGDRWAREEFAERLSMILRVAEESKSLLGRETTVQALAVADHLRHDDTAGALEILEATIERQRTAMAADEGAPGALPRDANLERLIARYQASYPWSPPDQSLKV